MNKPGPNCHKCPLKDVAGPVWGEGSSHAKLVVIGQCPGPDEVSVGRPFVGGSGRILESSLARSGYSRADTFITNTVKCFVQPKTPVPSGAGECCRPLLDRELETIDPGFTILTLGVEAFFELSGRRLMTVSPPRSIKKPPRTDTWLRGCVYRYNANTVVIPAAHPAYVASTGFYDAPFFDADIAKAVRWAKGGGVVYQESYDYNPSSSQVLDYVQKIIETGDFGADLETPEKSSAEEEEELLGEGPTEIQVCGISARPGECLGVPGDMLSLLKPLFTVKHPSPILCRVFNWGFEGYHFSRQYGTLSVVPIDLMLQLNRCYSDSKRKDLGTALSLFTDLDYTKNLSKVDPNRYNACDTYGALVGSRNAQAYMEKMNLWEDFVKEDVPLWQVILDMKSFGTNCDVEGAQRLELQMYTALDGYVKWWNSKLPTVDWQSPQQLIALFTALGLPTVMRKRVGKNKEVKYTPSVDQEVLEMYRDKHQNNIANLLLTMRELKKASDFTHIYSGDGRIHPDHKIHGQRAGRIQAKNPDLQNIPEELAGIYPRTIIIPDNPTSDVIISADFEAIEFFVYGYAAQDEPILRARREGIYIYGIFYEEIFHENFFQPGKPPKKPYRRKDIPPWKLLVAKSGPLGMLYGRGAKSLEDGFGIAKSEASKIYNTFFKEHWRVASHHEALITEATSNGYCRNYFNRIRRFPNPRGMRNEILAFTGQSNAADILIRNALIPLSRGLNNFGARLLFPVHDSIQVTCPRASAEGCASYIQECLESPIPEMNNYWIPCVIKIGPNWGDCKPLEDWLDDKYTRAVGGVQGLSS